MVSAFFHPNAVNRSPRGSETVRFSKTFGSLKEVPETATILPFSQEQGI